MMFMEENRNNKQFNLCGTNHKKRHTLRLLSYKIILVVIVSMQLFLLFKTYTNVVVKLDKSLLDRWDTLVTKFNLDCYAVLTINLPAKRLPAKWLFRWPQGLHVYEIDTEENNILPIYIANGRNEIDSTTRFALPKLQRDVNPMNQAVEPKKWITKLKPKKDRLVQIQQTRDFILILEHFYNIRCKATLYRYIFYIEDDFLPCAKEFKNLVRILRWANHNYDQISFIRFTYGLGAVLFQCVDVPHLIHYLKKHISTPGVDYLVDTFYNNETEWGKRCRSDTACLMRRSYTVYRSNFYHGGTNKSTIWTTQNTAVFESKGCSILETVIEYYTGYDNLKSCIGENVISPCPNAWLLPIW